MRIIVSPTTTIENPTTGAFAIADPLNIRDGDPDTFSQTQVTRTTEPAEARFHSGTVAGSAKTWVGVEVDWEIVSFNNAGDTGVSGQIIVIADNNTTTMGSITAVTDGVPIARRTDVFRLPSTRYIDGALDFKVLVKFDLLSPLLDTTQMTGKVYELRLVAIPRGDVAIVEG